MRPVEGFGAQEHRLPPGHRIHPDERPRLPEVPEGRRTVARPRPMRRFAPADLDPQPEVVGPLPPVPGQDAVEPGEGDRAGPLRQPGESSSPVA